MDIKRGGQDMAVSGTEKLTERRAEQLAELLLNNLESVSTPLLLRLNNESFRIRFKREAPVIFVPYSFKHI